MLPKTTMQQILSTHALASPPLHRSPINVQSLNVEIWNMDVMEREGIKLRTRQPEKGSGDGECRQRATGSERQKWGCRDRFALSHQSVSDDVVFHTSKELRGRTNQVSNSAEWLLQPFFSSLDLWDNCFWLFFSWLKMQWAESDLSPK